MGFRPKLEARVTLEHKGCKQCGEILISQQLTPLSANQSQDRSSRTYYENPFNLSIALLTIEAFSFQSQVELVQCRLPKHQTILFIEMYFAFLCNVSIPVALCFQRIVCNSDFAFMALQTA